MSSRRKMKQGEVGGLLERQLCTGELSRLRRGRSWQERWKNPEGWKTELYPMSPN